MKQVKTSVPMGSLEEAWLSKAPKVEAYELHVVLFKNIYYIAKSLNLLLHYESLNSHISMLIQEMERKLQKLNEKFDNSGEYLK